VVETIIHHPTDSGLLADSVRVVGRLARRAKAVVDKNVKAEAPDERFRDRSRSAKRLTKQIDQLARRLRSDTARDAHQEAYGKLLKIVHTTMKQAERLVEVLAGAPTRNKRKAPAQELGVESVCLPQRGVKTEERKTHEKQRWFKRG